MYHHPSCEKCMRKSATQWLSRFVLLSSHLKNSFMTRIRPESRSVRPQIFVRVRTWRVKQAGLQMKGTSLLQHWERPQTKLTLLWENEQFDHKGPFIFYEVGGAGGIFWSVIRKLHDPPQWLNFFPWPPSNKGIFFRWPPLLPFPQTEKIVKLTSYT